MWTVIALSMQERLLVVFWQLCVYGVRVDCGKAERSWVPIVHIRSIIETVTKLLSNDITNG